MEINIRTFYTIGIVAFFIIAIMNLGALLSIYKDLLIFDIVSRAASVAFNFALVGFFIYLKKQLPPVLNKIPNEEEIITMLHTPTNMKDKS